MVNAAYVPADITLAPQAGAAAEEGTTAGLAISGRGRTDIGIHPLIEPRSRGGLDVSRLLPLAVVGNAPDRSAGIITHQQRTIFRNRQRGRAAPHLGSALA